MKRRRPRRGLSRPGRDLGAGEALVVGVVSSVAANGIYDRMRSRRDGDMPARRRSKTREEHLESLRYNRKDALEALGHAISMGAWKNAHKYLDQLEGIDRKIVDAERSPGARRSTRGKGLTETELFRLRRGRDPSSRDVSKPFEVGKTYDTWTPEDRELGDASDRGWTFDPVRMTLREAMYEVKQLGGFEPDSSPMPRTGTQLTLYETDGNVNYRTGAETRHALHVRGSESAMRRFREILCEEHPRMCQKKGARRNAVRSRRAVRGRRR